MKRFVGSVLLALISSGGCAHHQDKSPVASAAQSAAHPHPERSAASPRGASAGGHGDPLRGPDQTSIYFDFDSSLVRADARPVLEKIETELEGRSSSLKVEGNCDETGTTEYNLALGEARARAAKDYLVHLGVPASRIAIASWGSQRPKYSGHDEAAHAKNRRDDLLIR